MGWKPSTKKLFFRSLSTLQNAGVHILDALHSLAEQAPDEPSRRDIQAVAGRLASGYSLSEGLAGIEPAFSKIEVALVRVAERSGKLHTVLERLATRTEYLDRVRRELIAAVTYPAFALALSIILVVFAPVFVFSDLLELLQHSCQQLPLVTSIYLKFSRVVVSPAFFAVLLASGFFCWKAAKSLTQSEARALALEEILLTVPGLGRVLRAQAVSEACDALALCQQVGLPSLQSLRLSGEATFSLHLRNEFRLAEERLKNGYSLSEAFADSDFLDPMSRAVLATGEEAGKLSESLAGIGRQNGVRAKEAMDTFQKLLEPALLLFIGLIVGFIAVAILAPTLTLANTI